MIKVSELSNDSVKSDSKPKKSFFEGQESNKYTNKTPKDFRKNKDSLKKQNRTNKRNQYKNKKELSIELEEVDSDESIIFGQTIYIEEKPKDLE